MEESQFQEIFGINKEQYSEMFDGKDVKEVAKEIITEVQSDLPLEMQQRLNLVKLIVDEELGYKDEAEQEDVTENIKEVEELTDIHSFDKDMDEYLITIKVTTPTGLTYRDAEYADIHRVRQLAGNDKEVLYVAVDEEHLKPYEINEIYKNLNIKDMTNVFLEKALKKTFSDDAQLLAFDKDNKLVLGKKISYTSGSPVPEYTIHKYALAGDKSNIVLGNGNYLSDIESVRETWLKRGGSEESMKEFVYGETDTQKSDSDSTSTIHKNRR